MYKAEYMSWMMCRVSFMCLQHRQQQHLTLQDLKLVLFRCHCLHPQTRRPQLRHCRAKPRHHQVHFGQLLPVLPSAALLHFPSSPSDLCETLVNNKQ